MLFWWHNVISYSKSVECWISVIELVHFSRIEACTLCHWRQYADAQCQLEISNTWVTKRAKAGGWCVYSSKTGTFHDIWHLMWDAVITREHLFLSHIACAMCHWPQYTNKRCQLQLQRNQQRRRRHASRGTTHDEQPQLEQHGGGRISAVHPTWCFGSSFGGVVGTRLCLWRVEGLSGVLLYFTHSQKSKVRFCNLHSESW